VIAAALSALTTIAAMIPGLSSLVTALSNTYFNAKVKLTTARIGGDVTVAKALVTAAVTDNQTSVSRLKVIAGSKVLLFLIVGFALPYMIYEWQCIVIDKIWLDGKHATDPLGGDLSAWATTIIACLFGSGTALTAGHMYFNRSKAGE